MVAGKTSKIKEINTPSSTFKSLILTVKYLLTFVSMGIGPWCMNHVTLQYLTIMSFLFPFIFLHIFFSFLLFLSIYICNLGHGLSLEFGHLVILGDLAPNSSTMPSMLYMVSKLQGHI